MTTSDKQLIGQGLAEPTTCYYEFIIHPATYYENRITQLTTSFEENCCDYDNTRSIRSIVNIINDFILAVNTRYDGERLSIIIGKRYPDVMAKVYRVLDDCGLIPIVTESNGIKLYNIKTKGIVGY